MKLILGILAVSVLGIGAYETYANSNNPNEYTVVMKFTSGNTLALSDKYQGYDSCVNSAEYQLHSVVGKQSGANIRCTNDPITYK